MRATLVALVFGVALSVQAGAQTVSARVGGELTGVVGEKIMVPIAVDMGGAGGEKLGSYTARLAWNTAALSPCSSYPCDTIPGNFPAPQVNADSVGYGVLRFTAISPSGVGGLVTLEQFGFKVLSTTSSPLNLSFTEMSAAGTFTNLLPSLSVTSATFCSARGRWGDLDKDGQANSRDALAIISRVVGLPVDPQTFDVTLGDVDADTKVDSRDALIVLSYAVGLDVPGQRVLLPVPSDCATGSPKLLTLLPAAVQLVPRQVLRVVAQAVDGAGRAVAVTGTTWRSSNYDVASVDDGGLVSPHAPGTAVISAEVGPGVRATSTITVIARRPNWYVDVRATGAPIQLGTAALPLEHPAQAYPLITEGDTIRVASGAYFFQDNEDVSPYPGPGAGISRTPTYTGYEPLASGAVILGGAPGDTTTRPIFRPNTSYGVGVRLTGGQRTVIRNVVFDGFYEAIDIQAVRTLVLEDVLIHAMPDYSYSYGVYSCASGTIDTLRIDRTALIGDSLSPGGYAVYYGGCANPSAHVTLIRDSKIRFWGEGIYLSDSDSTAVLRSEISDNDGTGISINQEYSTSQALYVAHSLVERNASSAIYGYPLRRVVIDSSRIRAVSSDGMSLQGGCCGNPPLQLYMHGDSVYFDADDYTWLQVNDADTVAIDSLWFRNDPGQSYEYSDITANYVRLTNSKFLNVYSDPFDVSADRLLVDRTTFLGCPACTQSGVAIQVGNNNVGPIVTVTNSGFHNVNTALAMNAGDATSRLLATGNTVDSAYYGFNTRADSAVVADNQLFHIRFVGVNSLPATVTGPWKGIAVLRNQLSCLSGSAPYGIYVQLQSARIDDNGLRDCFQGIRVSNTSAFLQNVSVSRDTLLNSTGQAYGIEIDDRWRATVSRNRVVNASSGIVIQTSDTATVRVDSNAVSQSSSTGIYLNPSGGASILGIRNNIANNLNGIVVPEIGASGVFSFTLGAITGNTGFAVDNQGGPLLTATQNWWGDAAGPPGQGANAITLGVDASNPLATAPTDVPSLAPPAAWVAGLPVALRAAVATPPRPDGPRRKPKVATVAPVVPEGMPADQAARIAKTNELRAAQEQRNRERQDELDRRKAARRAAQAEQQ